MVLVAKLVKSGVKFIHDSPALVVFQIPPPTEPANQVSLLHHPDLL